MFSTIKTRTACLLRVHRRRLRIAALATLVCALAMGAYLYVNYRTQICFGMKFGAGMARHYSWQQIRENLAFGLYGYTHMLSIEYDPKRRIYSFDASIQKAARLGNLLRQGILEYHQGYFEEAVEHIDEHERRRGRSEKSRFWLAMSCMRLAEARNCLAILLDRVDDGELHATGAHCVMTHGTMCTLPLESIHFRQEYSRRAAEIFSDLMQNYDSGSRRYMWLLNFSQMTLGRFPDAVPEGSRVSQRFSDYFYGDRRRVLAGKYGGLNLVNRAKALGVDTFDAGKGVAVEDFNRDGYLDIITGGYYSATRFYVNDGGRGFIDRSAASGISQITGSHLITAADYDNDGWMDVFISHPAGTTDSGGFSLLRNQGDGTFRDVTTATGLLAADTLRQHSLFTFTSAWGDIDSDGDLDLFVANWGGDNPFCSRPPLHSSLYLNEGGHFRDVTRAYGLVEHVKYNHIIGAAFGDYDGDGYADLAMTSLIPGFKMLYHNRGGRGFSRTDMICAPKESGFMVSFVDINHDGRLDVVAGVSVLADANIRNAVFDDKADDYGYTMIWLQSEDGRFERRRDLLRDNMPMASMGLNFGDINNDGAYDFYLGKGNPEPWFVLPNFFYIGELDGRTPTGYLENISALNGVGTLQKGHGIVFFDYDNDGDQDIYSSLGGMWPGDAWPNEFFVNESDLGNSWTKIRLQGHRTNRFGLGARIRVIAETANGDAIERYYHMDNKTGFGSAPYLAHIGLMDATSIREIQVFWPGRTAAAKYPGKLNTLNVLEEI